LRRPPETAAAIARCPATGIMRGMEIAWPDRRSDVLNALDVLASEPPPLTCDGSDPRWPDLNNSVHWLVDDTSWDHNDPRDSIGTLLRDDNEADAVEQVVQAIVTVSERQGPTASDAQWFGDKDWPQVRRLAAQAAATLRA
jgi:hypothetical protein